MSGWSDGIYLVAGVFLGTYLWWGTLATLGSKERIEAMAVKEAQEIKADKLRRLFRVTQLPTKEERKREEATIARHEKYDAFESNFPQG